MGQSYSHLSLMEREEISPPVGLRREPAGARAQLLQFPSRLGESRFACQYLSQAARVLLPRSPD